MPKIKFAYNSTVHNSTDLSPFAIVYRKIPPSSYRFSSQLPVGEKFSNSASTLAEQVLSVKEQVRSRLEKSNAMYKEAADKKRGEKLFEKGDMVMLYLRKTRIIAGAYNKLKPKSMGSSKS